MCLLSASVSLFPPYPAAVVVVVLVADFISKIEIVLQMSRPMRYLLPCLRYICSRVGCRKINGAKMIQLREPRRQKKMETQRKSTKNWKQVATQATNSWSATWSGMRIIFRRVYWRRLQLWSLRARGGEVSSLRNVISENKILIATLYGRVLNAVLIPFPARRQRDAKRHLRVRSELGSSLH